MVVTFERVAFGLLLLGCADSKVLSKKIDFSSDLLYISSAACKYVRDSWMILNSEYKISSTRNMAYTGVHVACTKSAFITKLAPCVSARSKIKLILTFFTTRMAKLHIKSKKLSTDTFVQIRFWFFQWFPTFSAKLWVLNLLVTMGARDKFYYWSSALWAELAPFC